MIKHKTQIIEMFTALRLTANWWEHDYIGCELLRWSNMWRCSLLEGQDVWMIEISGLSTTGHCGLRCLTLRGSQLTDVRVHPSYLGLWIPLGTSYKSLDYWWHGRFRLPTFYFVRKMSSSGIFMTFSNKIKRDCLLHFPWKTMIVCIHFIRCPVKQARLTRSVPQVRT